MSMSIMERLCSINNRLSGVYFPKNDFYFVLKYMCNIRIRLRDIDDNN